VVLLPRKGEGFRPFYAIFHGGCPTTADLVGAFVPGGLMSDTRVKDVAHVGYV